MGPNRTYLHRINVAVAIELHFNKSILLLYVQMTLIEEATIPRQRDEREVLSGVRSRIVGLPGDEAGNVL